MFTVGQRKKGGPMLSDVVQPYVFKEFWTKCLSICVCRQNATKKSQTRAPMLPLFLSTFKLYIVERSDDRVNLKILLLFGIKLPVSLPFPLHPPTPQIKNTDANTHTHTPQNLYSFLTTKGRMLFLKHSRSYRIITLCKM